MIQLTLICQRRTDFVGIGFQDFRCSHFRRRWPHFDAIETRNHMKMQMEHHLTAGGFIELLDGDAIGLKCFFHCAGHTLGRLNDVAEIA